MLKLSTYEKPRVIVKAVQLNKDNVEEIVKWCGGRQVEEIGEETTFVGINVPTLAGAQRCSEGDYISKEEDGRFVVWDAFNFEKTYNQIGLRS